MPPFPMRRTMWYCAPSAASSAARSGSSAISIVWGMERVLVIGSGGAGKSTFAKRLAERLGLPLVHLDAIYWRDGWIETPKEEWRGIVARLIGEPRWVMDGNYGGTMDMRLAAADTVIFLDMPRVVCLWRVVKRYFQFRGHAHPGTPA